MFISAIMMLIKTFFYLRIFKSLTKLVIMIKKVVNDLTSFLIFFFIQIVIFSVIYGILAVNNYKSPQDENILNMIKLKYDQASTDAFEFDGQQYPGFEYKHLSLFLANIIRTMRFSLGDFEFGSILHLNTFESALFWITWLITVLMTCIVFLNFIIAEVSESYANVQESVEELILKE